MDAATVGALIGTTVSSLVGLLAWRTSEQARRTKERTDANAQALQAWQDLLEPYRVEVTRLQRELDEERAVTAALDKRVDQLHSENLRLKRGARDRPHP